MATYAEIDVGRKVFLEDDNTVYTIAAISLDKKKVYLEYLARTILGGSPTHGYEKQITEAVPIEKVQVRL